jgi:hypothetical protein
MEGFRTLRQMQVICARIQSSSYFQYCFLC